jgi:hypothetical protein
MHELSGHEPHEKRKLSLAWSEINPSIRTDWVPKKLRWIKVFECLIRRAYVLCRVAMALRIDHIWEKLLAQKLSKVSIRVVKRLECSTNSARVAHSLEH